MIGALANFVAGSRGLPTVGLVVAALVSAIGVQTVRLALAQRDLAQERAQVAQQVAAVTAMRRLDDQMRADAARGVADENERKIQSATAAAAAASDELGRLRNAIAAASGPAPKDPAASGQPHDPAVWPQLFGSCATALQQLAANADGLESQVSGLQSYVRNVCRPTE